MAQVVNVNFKLDEDVKKSMEQACNELGLSMSVEPFYSEENMARLKKAIHDLDAGKGTVHNENELVEQ